MSDRGILTGPSSAEKTTAPALPVKTPDYRLIISSLERKILANEAPEKTRRILSSERIWQDLAPDQQIQWAALAQMAGEVETALTVLERVNRSSPDNVRAWKDRLNLLLLLERKKEAAKTLSMAQKYIRDEELENLPAVHFRAEKAQPGEIDFADEAFAQFRTRERQIARYLSLFSGRKEAFARQWADRRESTQGYVPVRRPITSADIEDHLKGRVTYGIYLLQADSTVRLGVIDADLTAEYRKGKWTTDQRSRVYREKAFMVSRIQELSAETNLYPLEEFSGGKGYHFWYFFNQPIAASRVRSLLDRLAKKVSPDLSVFSLEVFPKQDQLSGKGFGNLVKLPLGIHRLTGKPSTFLQCKDKRVASQLAFLEGVKSASITSILSMEKKAVDQKVVAHPRWQQWTEQYPELALLEEKCPLLGGVIALCREGKTLDMKEERILFQTVGLLPRAKTLLHHLYAFMPEYNPHWVDFKLSRRRGTPLGCRRIHSLLAYTGDMCAFDRTAGYPHPLLHIDSENVGYQGEVSEKAQNLTDALENLRSAMDRVMVFMK